MNHLIAVYETVADAERVCDRLKEEKIPARDIRITRAPLAAEPLEPLESARTREALLGEPAISPETDLRDPTLNDPALREPDIAPERVGLTGAGHYESEGHGWFHDWLQRSSMPAAERDAILAHMTGLRAAVTVDMEDNDERDRAIEIMEEGGPVDVQRDTITAAPLTHEARLHEASLHEAPLHEATIRDETLRPASSLPPEMPPPVVPPVTPPPASPAARAGRVEEGEQVIPVVKEDISVGKRVREQRYRVRAYAVDKPVEEKVMLRDEHVEIEHRPLTGAAAIRAAEMPKDREIEVVERHEEPVVEKHGTRAEEIVVRKEVTEHPETVHGTVRETRVEVEKEPMTEKERAGPSAAKPDRRP